MSQSVVQTSLQSLGSHFQHLVCKTNVEYKNFDDLAMCKAYYMGIDNELQRELRRIPEE